jgi:hypothetical protein
VLACSAGVFSCILTVTAYSLLRISDGVSDSVDLFNIVTGTWSTAQLSVPRAQLAAASVGSLGIFAGGWTGSALLCRQQ